MALYSCIMGPYEGKEHELPTLNNILLKNIFKIEQNISSL